MTKRSLINTGQNSPLKHVSVERVGQKGSNLVNFNMPQSSTTKKTSPYIKITSNMNNT